MRRSSSTVSTGLLILSGLGELSFCGESSGGGTRNDGRREPARFDSDSLRFGVEIVVCDAAAASTPGAKTS